MASIARSPLALSVAAALSLLVTNPAQAHLVEDFGIRKGAPVHISLSSGFNGFVGAGIKKLQVDGVAMNGFCIDPFTMALHSSPGYKFVPLTKAPEAPWTLSASEATEISDLWAMFYKPMMKQKNAAGLQIAIWEIVGGDDFTVIGKSYGANRMLAALDSYSRPGARLIALTGPGQDYVVLTPPGQGNESTPPPHSTPIPTPHSTPIPTPHSTPIPTPHSTPIPTPHSTPIPTPHSTPIPPPQSTPTPTPQSTPTPTPHSTPTPTSTPARPALQARPLPQAPPLPQTRFQPPLP